jgi:hypothetical protein
MDSLWHPAPDIVATHMGTSSLQGKRSVLAEPNQRQSAWEVTISSSTPMDSVYWESRPAVEQPKAELSGHLLLLVGRLLLKAKGKFLEPTNASSRIQSILPWGAT